MNEGAPRFNPKKEESTPVPGQDISALEKAAEVLHKKTESLSHEVEAVSENDSEMEIHPAADLRDIIQFVKDKNNS